MMEYGIEIITVGVIVVIAVFVWCIKDLKK
jgi:hypothetical protein